MNHVIRTVLIAIVSLPMIAQAEGAPPESKCEPGNVRQSQEITTAVARFLRELQRAIATNDRERVASLVHYPLEVATKDRTFVVRAKADFIEKYDTIFSPEIKNVLMSQQPDCASISSHGGLMLGDGIIWFDSFADGKLSARGEFKITTVNPPIPLPSKNK